MLSVKVVEEICRLLAEDELSQRAIARRLSVSRGIVHAIASGRRGTYGHETLRHEEPSEGDSEPPRRCPTCGGMTLMPCLLCAARAYRGRNRQTENVCVRIEAPPPRRVA